MVIVAEGLCSACLCEGRKLSAIHEMSLNSVYCQFINEIPIYDMSHVSVLLCWECLAILKKICYFKETVKTSYCALLEYLCQKSSVDIKKLVKKTRLAIVEVYKDDITTTETEAESKAGEDELDLVKSESCLLNSEKAGQNSIEFIKPEPSEDIIFSDDIILYPQSGNDALDDADDKLSIEQSPQDELKFDNKYSSDVQSKVNEKRNLKKELKKKSKLKKTKRKKVTPVKKKKDKIQPEEPKTENKISEQISDGLSDLDSVGDLYGDNEDNEKLSEIKLKLPRRSRKIYDPNEIKLIKLSYEEMMQEREKERNSEYFMSSPNKCEYCILSFRYERTLQIHYETKHSETAGEHVCEICNVRFTDVTSLSAHVKRHLQCYRCALCDKRMATLIPMLKHVKNHKEYKCELCGEVSGSLFKHQTHIAKAHKEKPQCSECGKWFSSRKTYRYHMSVIHKGNNRFPCPHCGKIYQWKSNLWRHIKNHKARDSGQLHCEPCNKSFASVATFQQHLKISRKHVNENQFNYTCVECGKKFANKTRLRDHIDWEHLKKINYRCQLCHKPFKSNTSLYVHLQNVHKNKEEKDNLCHVCGKSYQNIAKLKYHIVAMHTSETPYTCEQCPSAFSWYSSLYRHVKEVHEKLRAKKKRKPKLRDVEAEEPHAGHYQPLAVTL